MRHSRKRCRGFVVLEATVDEGTFIRETVVDLLVDKELNCKYYLHLNRSKMLGNMIYLLVVNFGQGLNFRFFHRFRLYNLGLGFPIKVAGRDNALNHTLDFTIRRSSHFFVSIV